MSVGKVKRPVQAAYARFNPIYNHLTNMADYLDQAGLAELALRARVFMKDLGILERDIKSLREK